MSSTSISPMMTSSPSNTTSAEEPEDYHMVLLVMYSLLFLCGTISLSLMIHFIKSTSSSPTSIAILNLIFAHFVFLLTVPFRIYYYATDSWVLGENWCKIVSFMIHVHMYVSFILYVIILISRLLTFYNKSTRLMSVQRIHAFIISAVVWLIVFVMVICTSIFLYGTNMDEMNRKDNTTCFRFTKSIEKRIHVNYVISVFIIVVTFVLTTLQANVLRVLYKKHQQEWMSQQDFRAQLQSSFFALVMLCFIPYHAFRLYYINNLNKLDFNEVFLSLTAFICLDMLTFLGRRTCNVCLSGTA